jgi:hypothetical protein
MSRVHTLSEQLIDYGERLSRMADAAEGKRNRATATFGRWLLLPAAGAGLYALVRSDAFSRQAKEVVGDAKSRATELPEDLMSLVHQATNGASGRNARARTTTRETGRTRAKRSTPKRTSSPR